MTRIGGASIGNLTTTAPVGGSTSDNQTNGLQKTQIVDAGGEAVTVTGGKLDVNASVDTTGLALDATLTGGTQKSQIVDAGGEAVTVTGGKLDVNASVDTTGLATSAGQTTGNNSLSSIDTKTPALGQALAAGSVPVVLTASQLSTLTPPAAITNFALETGGNLSTVAGAVSSSKMNVNISSGSIANTSFEADLRVGGAAVTTANPVSIQPPLSGHLHIDGDGTAGTPAPGVVTVQGITSMVPIQVSQATASNLNATVVGTGTFAVQAAAQPGVDIGDVTINNSTGAAAVNIQDGGNTITVDNGGTFATQATLQTGTNSIGKISDITTSVVPGTGATNLGKAVQGTPGTTDTGVVALAVRKSTDVHDGNVTDGQYGRLSTTDFMELKTRDQRAIDLANCNVSTDYTVLGNDTINLANSTNHVFGTGAITFDKANGAANTVYAGVSKSFTAINLSEIFEAGGFVGLSVYLSSLANVVNVFLRIGTDASNYNCWTWPVAALSAATWLNLRQSAAQPDYARNAGNGWNPAAITYVSFGVEFAGETNTLAGILMDHVHIVGGRVTATDINTAVSSSVTTPNINVHRIGGNPTDVGNGTASTGTQRVTIASDSTGQVKLAASSGTEIGKLSANSGVDIGDVTINNSTGAAAVNIQDGGNSITVDNGGTFATQATLAAETTKVIGTVRTADGSGNLYTTNSTTYTAKNAQDANLLGTLGTAFSTAGKVDVKGADGDVFVRQATASNLNATVVGTGTFATQSAITAAASSIADGASVTLGAKADAKSTATDTTAVSIMSVLKEISAMEQAPASRAVTNAGTFATQATLQTQTDTVMVGGVNVKEINGVTPLMGNGTTGTGSMRVTIASDNTANSNPFLVTPTPTTAASLSVANFNSGDTYTALTNSAQVIKASAGNLYGYYIMNPNTSTAYVMVYNVAAASVTVGTTTALMVFAIPAGSAANLMMPYPVSFDTAMSIAAATTGGGNTAPTTALEVQIWFK